MGSTTLHSKMGEWATTVALIEVTAKFFFVIFGSMTTKRFCEEFDIDWVGIFDWNHGCERKGRQGAGSASHIATHQPRQNDLLGSLGMK